MAYATVAQLKAYIGGYDSTSDDALLGELLDRASSWFDGQTHRTFAASADSTRTYDAVGPHIRGYELHFPDGAELAAITSVTNGDGVVLSTSEYTTAPRNATPYYGLRILGSAGKTWTYTTDWEDAISIVGRWAYSTTPPDDVRQAVLDIAKQMYRARADDGGDRTIIAEGMVITPSNIPSTARATVERYRRLA